MIVVMLLIVGLLAWIVWDRYFKNKNILNQVSKNIEPVKIDLVDDKDLSTGHQGRIKKIIPVIGLIGVLLLLLGNAVYKHYVASINNYLGKFESDCIHGSPEIIVKNRHMFCKCARKQMVAPIVKKIGIEEFEIKYRTEPYLALMAKITTDSCGHYLK